MVLFVLTEDHFTCTLLRSAPEGTLHTMILGSCKCLLKSFMSKRTAREKKKLLPRISAYNKSGFSVWMYRNVCYYYQSFVGEDFKGWMQMALFIILPYLIVTT